MSNCSLERKRAGPLDRAKILGDEVSGRTAGRKWKAGRIQTVKQLFSMCGQRPVWWWRRWGGLLIGSWGLDVTGAFVHGHTPAPSGTMCSRSLFWADVCVLLYLFTDSPFKGSTIADMPCIKSTPEHNALFWPWPIPHRYLYPHNRPVCSPKCITHSSYMDGSFLI